MHVLPGQSFRQSLHETNGITSSTQQEFVATKCGVNIEGQVVGVGQGKYESQVGDNVIGVVIDKGAEGYIVDINATRTATLSIYHFEGVTRKNRPSIVPGDLVYATITASNSFFLTQIKCVNEVGKSQDYGLLTDGLLMKCSLSTCRRLLAPNSFIQYLGKYVQFEIIIGVNGYIWIKSDARQNVVTVRKYIAQSEHSSDKLMQNLVLKRYQ